MAKNYGHIVPVRGVAEAKNEFSAVFALALHHQPQLIQRHAHADETVVAISLEDLRRALADRQFHTEVSFGDSEVIAALENFSLLGAGLTLDDAVDELLSEMRVFCRRYVEDLEFYQRTSSIALLPWVLRFALTPSDQQRALLLEPPHNIIGEQEPSAASA